METPADLASQPLDESILKPKPQRRAPSFTPEQRKAMSDRMKKVNADRIANSKTTEARLVKEKTREEKKKQLEEELRLLKEEVKSAPARLAPVPKKKPVPNPKVYDPYDDLIDQVKEVRKAKQAVAVAPEPEPESEEEPEPAPLKTRKPRQPKPPAEPKIVCKYL